MAGLKFKVAHKRAGSEKWSGTPRTQRKRLIMFLQGVIADLEKQNEAAGGVVQPRRKTAGILSVRARRHARVHRSQGSRAPTAG